MMKIAVIRERANNEHRVAVTPDLVKQYIKNNFTVWLEEGAGQSAGFTDAEYKANGAIISKIPLEILSDADIILKVQPTPYDDKINETEFAQQNVVIIGLLNHYMYGEVKTDLLSIYKHRGFSSLAMELVPRTTKAQSMDALSSQANLAGYRAVIEAAYHLKKALPIYMTAAGTVQPAKVLVLGAGVAGLQAIATAKRLGAVVAALDARSSAREQVESVGGKFITVETTENFETTGGYAQEVSNEYKLKQQLLLAEQLKLHDIIITTAQIPGKKAPCLISKDMLDHMQNGAVIIDLAAATGGNVELTEYNKIIEYNNIKIIGYSDMPTKIAYDASKLYAKNLFNLVMHMFDNGKATDFDIEDDIIKAMLLTHRGRAFNK